MLESAPGRVLFFRGGGVCLPGQCLLEGAFFSGGVLPSPWGGGIPACTEADPTPVNRITDTSKNITSATTSLRPLIKRVQIRENTNILAAVRDQ